MVSREWVVAFRRVPNESRPGLKNINFDTPGEETQRQRKNNVRPFVIGNYSVQDSLTLLWMNVEKYLHYTDVKTAIKMNIR
jgi:hypothetical protein